ncbi:MAG: serine/threonine protein kinase [Anaerolineae bacterium]|nr:serine/threonine protein kinase [Anaerolineae bacterium]
MNKTLGKYEVQARLGRGGMAEVYKGYHPALDRFVAIKVLHAFLADDTEFKDRFEREARNIARLRHPHIVQVFDFDFDASSESYYMVMELINGPTLKDHLENLERDGQRVSIEEAVRITKEAAGALAYAHGRGMIHRDVKPANLMLDQENERIVLTDFGIAKIITGGQFTASGGMVGTPAFMSPEQGLGESGDERSDLYSLAVILYQMVTNQLPFDAETPLAVILKHLNEPLPLPREINPDVPPWVEQVIVRGLAKDPADRFQTAEEFIGALDAGEQGTPQNIDIAALLRTTSLNITPISDATQPVPPQPGLLTTNLEGVGPRSSLLPTAIISGLIVFGFLVVILLMLGQGGTGPLAPVFVTATPEEIALGGSATLVQAPPETATLTLTPTEVATDTPTFTPSPTATDTPTPTYTPTNTPTPADARARVVAPIAPLYENPDPTSRRLSDLPQGVADVLVTRITADEEWYEVNYLGVVGWINAGQIEVTGNLATIGVFIPPTPTPSPTFTASPSPTPSPTFTLTPSLTPQVPTALPCIVTMFSTQAPTVVIRALPNPTSAQTAELPVATTRTATARTVDGWFLVEEGWVSASAVTPSSEILCSGLSIIDASTSLEALPLPPSVCDVQTGSAANLHRGASFGTVPVTTVPGGTLLPVFAVVTGDDGRIWYQTTWADPNGVAFRGWILADLAGTLVGACPAPSPSVSLFGNPYINPLELTQAPLYSTNFNMDDGAWTLLPIGGELEITDGKLSLTAPAGAAAGMTLQAPEIGFYRDGYLSQQITVPASAQEGSEFFLDIVVRDFYAIRINAQGGLTLTSAQNASLIFDRTDDGALDLATGVTLGIHLNGSTLSLYLDGQLLREITDNTRDQGVILRYNLANRNPETPVTLLLDDVAYWDLSTAE